MVGQKHVFSFTKLLFHSAKYSNLRGAGKNLKSRLKFLECQIENVTIEGKTEFQF